MTEKKLKVWKVYPEDHKRLDRLGRRDQTQPNIIHDLITETEWLPKLKAILESGTKRVEEAKKNPSRTVELFQAVDALVRGLEEFIAHVEERSK